MENKKLVILCMLLLIPLFTMAQTRYVVSKVSGGVQKITPKGKQRVYKGQVLTEDMTLNLSFSGSLTLLAEGDDKQYVINSPGKAKLSSFLADKRNTVLVLTKDYVKSVVAQLRQDKTVKSRRHSDPATVTRELLVKDSLLIKDSLQVVTDSTATAQPDSTQCEQTKTTE